MTQSGTKKKIKPRVVNADTSDDILQDKITIKPTALLEGNVDHLETKKQVETLRKEHGDNWLNNHGATLNNSVIIDDLTLPTPEQMIESLLKETRKPESTSPRISETQNSMSNAVDSPINVS